MADPANKPVFSKKSERSRTLLEAILEGVGQGLEGMTPDQAAAYWRSKGGYFGPEGSIVREAPAAGLDVYDPNDANATRVAIRTKEGGPAYLKGGTEPLFVKGTDQYGNPINTRIDSETGERFLFGEDMDNVEISRPNEKRYMFTKKGEATRDVTDLFEEALDAGPSLRGHMPIIGNKGFFTGEKGVVREVGSAISEHLTGTEPLDMFKEGISNRVGGTLKKGYWGALKASMLDQLVTGGQLTAGLSAAAGSGYTTNPGSMTWNMGRMNVPFLSTWMGEPESPSRDLGVIGGLRSLAGLPVAKKPQEFGPNPITEDERDARAAGIKSVFGSGSQMAISPESGLSSANWDMLTKSDPELVNALIRSAGSDKVKDAVSGAEFRKELQAKYEGYANEARNDPTKVWNELTGSLSDLYKNEESIAGSKGAKYKRPNMPEVIRLPYPVVGEDGKKSFVALYKPKDSTRVRSVVIKEGAKPESLTDKDIEWK